MWRREKRRTWVAQGHEEAEVLHHQKRAPQMWINEWSGIANFQLVHASHACFPWVLSATDAGGNQDLEVGIVKYPWKTHFLIDKPENMDV